MPSHRPRASSTEPPRRRRRRRDLHGAAHDRRGGGPRRRESGHHLDAGRLRHGRGAQGAQARAVRLPLQRQCADRGRDRAEAPRRRQAALDDGAGLRDGHRRRRAARLRQRRAARADRPRRRVGHRAPAGELSRRPAGRRGLAGDRRGQPRPRRARRRPHDAGGDRAARRRSGHGGHRARVQAAGGRGRAGRAGPGARVRQARRRELRRRRARADRGRGAFPAATLADAARLAVALARGEPTAGPPPAARDPLLAGTRARPGRLAAGQRYVRGLYSGGTLCQEAKLILAAGDARGRPPDRRATP